MALIRFKQAQPPDDQVQVTKIVLGFTFLESYSQGFTFFIIYIQIFGGAETRISGGSYTSNGGGDSYTVNTFV